MHLYIALLDIFKVSLLSCRFFNTLTNPHKGLMVPYMNYLVTSVTQLLQEYQTGEYDDQEVWHTLLEMLRKTFTYDETSQY